VPDEPQVKQFTFQIDAGARLRVHLEKLKGELVHFAITLECEAGERWQAVVRYDTTGGKPHRDILLPGGGYVEHRDDVNLSEDYATALKQAQHDLTASYQGYVSDFLERLG
jgi:hypothetical protein